MPRLYPSWIEISVNDLDRALGFYRAVFELTDTPIYHEPSAVIAVLLPSEKSMSNPGVSLVKSPLHKPADGGTIVNFHIDSHHALEAAVRRIREFGGVLDSEIIDTGDGVRYINILDSEGNRIALSSYEALDGEDNLGKLSD
jgi:predicted enzyme related to lactoylglutathione lyase